MKIPHILCVAYHKFNEVHHYFIMKVKEILNNFFHVYAINMTMIACVTTFWAYAMLSPKTWKLKLESHGINLFHNEEWT